MRAFILALVGCLILVCNAPVYGQEAGNDAAHKKSEKVEKKLDIDNDVSNVNDAAVHKSDSRDSRRVSSGNTFLGIVPLTLISVLLCVVTIMGYIIYFLFKKYRNIEGDRDKIKEQLRLCKSNNQKLEKKLGEKEKEIDHLRKRIEKLFTDGENKDNEIALLKKENISTEIEKNNPVDLAESIDVNNEEIANVSEKTKAPEPSLVNDLYFGEPIRDTNPPQWRVDTKVNKEEAHYFKLSVSNNEGTFELHPYKTKDGVEKPLLRSVTNDRGAFSGVLLVTSASSAPKTFETESLGRVELKGNAWIVTEPTKVTMK